VADQGGPVLLGRHGDVHQHNGRGRTLCGRPVRAGDAVAVSQSQIMVYGLMLCTECYHPTSYRKERQHALGTS
jgi:hypothetical protein